MNCNSDTIVIRFEGSSGLQYKAYVNIINENMIFVLINYLLSLVIICVLGKT